MSKNIKLESKPIIDDTIPIIKEEFNKLNISPKLCIFTNSNPDNLSYIKSLKRTCDKVGIEIVNEEELNDNIPCLFLKGADVNSVPWMIYCCNNMDLYPYTTPNAVMNLLDYYNIPIQGQMITIIGRSRNLGKPLFELLTKKNATVTLCHSYTQKEQLEKLNQISDIVISACGCKNVLTKSNPNSIYIDIGINVNDDGTISGDLHPDIFNDCKAYTPVPGCIGPLTCLEICKNVLNFYIDNLN